jgi:hypothetical protein
MLRVLLQLGNLRLGLRFDRRDVAINLAKARHLGH